MLKVFVDGAKNVIKVCTFYLLIFISIEMYIAINHNFYTLLKI